MATNEFLPFAGDSGANVLAQAAYAGLGARSGGFVRGTAASNQFNKVLRQSTAMAAMVGEFLRTVGGLDALDNGDVATLLANFVASLDKRSSSSRIGAFITVVASPLATPVSSPSDGDEYPVAAGATGAWAGKDGQIARWSASSAAWSFDACRIGRIVRIANTDTFYQRVSGGWNAYTFGAHVNPTVAWGGITGILDNQSDLSMRLAAFVKLAPPGAAAQTIAGPLNVSGRISAAGADLADALTGTSASFNSTLSGASGLFGASSGTNARVAVSAKGAVGFVEAFQAADFTAKLPLGLNPWGGNVLIGTPIDNGERVQVNGNISVNGNIRLASVLGDGGAVIGGGQGDGASTTIANLRLSSWWGVAFAPSCGAGTVPVTENSHWFDTRNGDFGFRGALAPGGDFGTVGKMLASQGPGAPARWQAAVDTTPALHYEHRLPSGGGWSGMFAEQSVWTNMPLNTAIKAAIPGASALGAGVFNVPAGTYRAQFYGAIAVSDSMFRVRLRDATNGITLGVGSYAFRWDGLETIIPSIGWCEFTLPAAANISLQLWFMRTQNPVAGGYLRGFADGESVPAFSLFLTKVG